MLRILETHPELRPYARDLDYRMERLQAKRRQLLGESGRLVDFANAHAYYGFHRQADGWVYREWAPGA